MIVLFSTGQPSELAASTGIHRTPRVVSLPGIVTATLQAYS